MKHLLSPEQSATLIAKGISADKASERTPDYKDINNTGKPFERRELLPIFTLADLFALLPKDIEMDFPNADGGIDTEDCYLCTQWCINGYYADNHQWCVFYTPGFQVVGDFCAKELIDALYKCLIWAIDHNHVKLD